MNSSRRAALGRIAAGVAAAAVMPSALAQGDTIKIMVGFPAGGLPDLIARALSEQLRAAFGVPAIVENRPGANGRLAGQAVKKAAPDGNTLLVAPASNIVFLPHVYSDLGYDPMVDFVPVAQFVENDFAFAVNPKVPVESIAQWADWCRKNRERAAYGSPGKGSAMHFMGHVLSKALDVPMKHVPYRGTTMALNDVTGGHIASMWATTSFLIPHHAGGRVRILATTGEGRSPKLPQVPTFRELGLKGLAIVEGIWLLAPAGTPAPRLDKLSTVATDSVKSKEMQAISTGQDASMAPLGRKELAKVMKQEFEERRLAVASAAFALDR